MTYPSIVNGDALKEEHIFRFFAGVNDGSQVTIPANAVKSGIMVWANVSQSAESPGTAGDNSCTFYLEVGSPSQGTLKESTSLNLGASIDGQGGVKVTHGKVLMYFDSGTNWSDENVVNIGKSGTGPSVEGVWVFGW